jgi:methionine synthase II (cobalamin-independent)
LSRVRAVEEHRAEAALRAVTDAVDVSTAVHCCARDVPLALLHHAGFGALSVDVATAALDLDVVGPAVEQGLHLWLGVVPALGPGVPPAPRDVVLPVRRLWSDLGFPVELLAERVTVTPACGLAGASTGWAATAMRLARQGAKILADAPEAAPR